jgi:hypothetical protein
MYSYSEFHPNLVLEYMPLRFLCCKKMTVFWDVAPCSLVLAASVIGAVTLMMEAASTSETSENFYQTTRRNIPEDIYLHTRRSEKLKFFAARFQ